MFLPRIFLTLACLGMAVLHAEENRALKPGQTLPDARQRPLRDLDGPLLFTPPATQAEWNQRAETLRMRLRVALGLWPEPTRTDLRAVVHGRLDCGDYTVNKVFFESLPGFFVTGNLYRPIGGGKHPGVLCPHGHWPNGRFMRKTDEEVRAAYASGAERLENAARSPLQARCVQLARMGCVVFHYDMIGQGDCLQIPDEIAHRFKQQRPEMNGAEGWGFYSPQAELWGQNIMGLQTWNSLRALDFLTQLEDVDSTRLGVTGASGGGTQTMMLAALDPRVTAAFPAVMVSTVMQGGCTCENASGLRVGHGNVEFAALFAPKPLAMTCANDWTKEMPVRGFPEMQKLWALLGRAENVALTVGTQFPHNYNAPSRAAMYAWFNQHLALNLASERLEERDFRLLSREEMSVWNAAHPAPEGGLEFERKLLRAWRDDVRKQGVNWKELLGEANGWRAIFGRGPGEFGEVKWEMAQKVDGGEYWRLTGLVKNATFQEAIPATFLHPKSWNGAMVLWLSERGKQGLFSDKNEPVPEVARLLARGVGVIGIDLAHQGEALPAGNDGNRAPAVENPRESLAYTLGYNDPVFVQRVHDVCTIAQLVKTDAHKARALGVVATDKTAAIAAAACWGTGGEISATLLRDPEFRFAGITDIRDPYLLPNASRYGDVPGLLQRPPQTLRVVGGAEDLALALDWLVDCLAAPRK